jgi:hypothetical protein
MCVADLDLHGAPPERKNVKSPEAINMLLLRSKTEGLQ